MNWNKIQDKSPRDKEVVIVWDGSSFEFCKYLNGKFILRDANKPTELSSSYKTREDITNIVEAWAELEKPKDKFDRGEFARPSGAEAFTKLTYDAYDVDEVMSMSPVSGIIKSWIEVHLRLKDWIEENIEWAEKKKKTLIVDHSPIEMSKIEYKKRTLAIRQEAWRYVLDKIEEIELSTKSKLKDEEKPKKVINGIIQVGTLTKSVKEVLENPNPADFLEWLEHKYQQDAQVKKVDPDSSLADRFNDGKTEWALLHFKSLEPLVRVMMFGKGKYGRNNWRKGLPYTKIVESIQRHIVEFLDGEDHDKESGETHIGHMLANAMMLSYMFMHRKDLDDRDTGWEDDNNKLSNLF